MAAYSIKITFSIYDSGSFPGNCIKSAHGSIIFPRSCFGLTSDSSSFWKYCFEWTHDSSGELYSAWVMNKLWVVPKSASNTGSISVRAVHTSTDSRLDWQVRVRCWVLSKGVWQNQDPFRNGLGQVQGGATRAGPVQGITSEDGALIRAESTQLALIKYMIIQWLNIKVL